MLLKFKEKKLNDININHMTSQIYEQNNTKFHRY